jgi:hypothetical protein
MQPLNYSSFLYWITLFLLLSVGRIPYLQGQAFGPVDSRFNTISQNSVSSLEASGSTLWLGPGLNAYFEENGEIYIPQGADSVFTGRGRVFSLAAEENRVLAGIGYTSIRGGDPSQAAMGYYQTTSIGNSWEFIPFPLDDRPPEECDGNSVGPPCDIEFEYGDETYLRTRITVPELSPPFEVDFFNNTLFSVNWASGLLRSLDNGLTWERMILPPSSTSGISPDNYYQWNSQTSSGQLVNRYDPRFDTNLLGFGLLIDDRQRLWVGTAGGINISENALTASKAEVEWKRYSFDPDNNEGLLANWIVSIRQEPGTDRIWMTNWRTDSQNRDTSGIVYTDDDGETFHRFLEGIRVNDIGFYENKIYAAADNGLYISDDTGQSWIKVDRISSPNSFIRKDTRYLALASTEEQLWVGTGDGVAATADGGLTWRILRVDVPLRGGNIYQPDAPDVSTYAYPNPFSPKQHSVVRIKFDLNSMTQASVRIFDFGMNPVRTITVDPGAPGNYEAIWDGTDQTGRLVANGTYFYIVDKPGGRDNGKILLID